MTEIVNGTIYLVVERAVHLLSPGDIIELADDTLAYVSNLMPMRRRGGGWWVTLHSDGESGRVEFSADAVVHVLKRLEPEA